METLLQLVTSSSLIGCRISGLIMFAPMLGSSSIPVRVKVGLAFALTWLLSPVQTRGSAAVPQFGAAVLSELMIGMLLGLSVALVFEAAQLAGQVLGFQMGYSLVNVLDPQTQVDTPVLASLNQAIVLLIFLRLDVHLLMLRGIARSYSYLPSGLSMLRGNAVEAIVRGASSMWLAGVEIAAPALVATMVADIVLAFVGKAAPQLPVLFVGLSLKMMLGGAVVAASLLTWPELFTRYFTEAVALGERALHLVG